MLSKRSSAPVRALYSGLALAVIPPLLTTTAHGQEVGGVKALDEITVTARKREETLKDVPATVYVFTE